MSKANKENIFLMKNNNKMSYVSKVIKIIMICLRTGEITLLTRIQQNGPKWVESTRMGRNLKQDRREV